MRLEPSACQIFCTELTAIPTALAIARAVQWVAAGGFSVVVLVTT